MPAIPTAFPAISAPFVGPGGLITQPWQQLLISLWDRTGGGGGLISLDVNPGTGNQVRDINVALADYANVNDYLNVLDVYYDGAFARAIAARGHVYAPGKAWRNGPFYKLQAPIVLNTGQSIRGDGPGVTVLQSVTPNQPVILLGHSIFEFYIADLSLIHLGAALAGGDGIAMGQGLTDWVNDGSVRNVHALQNYVNFNLGKAFGGQLVDCQSISPVSHGFAMTTTGNSDIGGGTNAGGPIQWVLQNCFSSSSGGDNYLWTNTGVGFGGAPTSVGTMIDCDDFNAGRYSVNYQGSAAQPIASARVAGGFFGQSTQHGIRLDTYGGEHYIRFDFIELAGYPAAGGGLNVANGVLITANNSSTQIVVGEINGCAGDGILNSAIGTSINLGQIISCGQGLVAGNRSGIRFAGVIGQITGTKCTDGGAALQLYGFSSDIEGSILTGCDLRGNVTAPVNIPLVLLTTQITGCLPPTINQLYADTLHVYGASAFLGAGGLSGTFGINVQAGGANFLTGIVGNNINAIDDVTIRHSLGVGLLAPGTIGMIKLSGNLIGAGALPWSINGTTANLFLSGSIGLNDQPASATPGDFAGDTLHVSGAAALHSTTIVSGGLAVTGGINTDNIEATVSMGCGAGATGSSGLFSQKVLTFAALPAPAGLKGISAYISDSNTAVFLAIAAGGGATNTRVTSDGAHWLVG